MPDKPLYVQVAEALGCTPTLKHTEIPGWRCACPDGKHGWELVPHYDSDWSATGPLIERYSIALDPCAKPPHPEAWMAHDGRGGDVNDSSHLAYGPTPLIAVCNLILELHKAGKLA